MEETQPDKKEESVIKDTKTRECPRCHQSMEVKTGLHNVKNLFKAPTFDEWISLFIIIMVIVSAYAYNHDVKTCRETLNNIDQICVQYNANAVLANDSDKTYVNYTNPLLNINFTPVEEEGTK